MYQPAAPTYGKMAAHLATAQKPVVDGIAPHLRLAGLVVELGQDVVVAAVVDASLERLPLVNVAIDGVRSLVMRIVEMLDHRLAGVKFVGIGNMVEEEQQLVGTGFQGFVHLGNNWTVLSSVAGAFGDGTLHAGALIVGIVPLAPAVAFGGFDADAVVVANNISEGLEAERAGIVLSLIHISEPTRLGMISYAV